MKYKRFVDAAGGWAALQAILAALDRVARRKSVSIANVATRWTLEHPAVAAAIVGARLGERRHTDDNLAVFSFALDEDDRALIDEALAEHDSARRRLRRRISQGPVSHRLGRPQPSSRSRCLECTRRRASKAVPAGCASRREAPSSRSPAIAAPCGWETACWSAAPRRPTGRTRLSAAAIRRRKRRSSSTRSPRALRRWALVSTTSCAPASISATRTQWEPVARAHGRYFGSTRPANTMLEIARLIGDYEVEIEAEAVVD